MKITYTVILTVLIFFRSNAQYKIDSSSIYFELKQYNKAATFSIKNKLLDKLDDFGFQLFRVKDYKNSLFFFSKAKENSLGLNNQSDYKSRLDMIGFNYQELGDFNNAIKYFEEAYIINTKINGINDESNLSCIANLLVNYRALENYKKQCEYYEKVILIQEFRLGAKHPQTLISKNNLAYLYNLDGNYKKAELLYSDVLKIREELYGQNNIDYAISLSNLATLYSDKGEYSKAEDFTIKSLKIKKLVLGEEDPDYAISLNNLAAIYIELGVYKKAETLLIECTTLQKKVLGEEDLTYANSLNLLGDLYRQMGEYSKAETLIMRCLSIQKNILGEEHLDYAYTLNSLGTLYRQMKNRPKAEEFYLKSLELLRAKIGEEHPNYATSLNNLALLYHDMLRYDKSEAFYIKSLEITKNVFGDEHPDYINSVSNLAALYDDRGDSKKAENLYSNLISISKKKYKEYSSFLNNEELFQYINNRIKVDYESGMSFLKRRPESKILNQLLEFDLLLKNALLYNNLLLERAAVKSQDSILIQVWSEYKYLHKTLANRLQLPISQQIDIYKLKNQTDSLEKVLMRNLPEFQQFVSNNKLTFVEVQKNIKSKEAVIDFVRFKYFNRSWSDSILYAAFIYNPELKQPRFINLFSEEELSSLFDSSNTSYSINNLYCGKNGAIDSNCNSTLYNLIWHPMDSLLKGVKKVYISPSGLLNRIAFSAIPTPEGGRLIDRFFIDQISNIRTIAGKSIIPEDTIKSIILIGGADFNVEPTFSDKLNVNYVSTDTLFSEIRSLHEGKWSYLAGSENEVNAIKNIAVPSKISTNLLTGSNASEESFKKIGFENTTAPSVIHIATHGFAFTIPKKIPNEGKFVLQDNKTNVFRMSEDPLTRAGLVMAGGNQVWATGIPYPNHDDGILTAREVSELNLNGCVLATLSACETGLGEIKGSEGVFGLQRAFKMAGVKYLIVSLWKVPDAQTTEFMQLFYSSWLIQKLPIRDAFRQTQITMSNKYTPYQWAAFILVE
jgi:CHAT domain-containing protein/tetratricopeptide (TPR) repeat protein